MIAVQSARDVVPNRADRFARAAAEGLAANVLRFLGFQGLPDGAPIELQSLDVPDGKYFDNRVAYARNAAEAVRLATEAEGFGAPGVFFILNAIDPAAATRIVPGKWTKAKKGVSTKDSDITHRQVVYIDVDSVRPTGTSSTDAQMKSALATSELIRRRLVAANVPESAIGLGMSGNGAAVMVALDAIPESPRLADLVSGILATLDGLFSSPTVKVDVSVSDAKRLGPVWGTTKRKGAPGIPDYPHRQSSFLCAEVVERLSLADLEMVHASLRLDLTPEQCNAVDKAIGKKTLVTTRTTTSTGTTTAGDDVFARAKQCNVEQVATRLGLLEGDLVRCPGCSTADGSSVVLFENGLKCSHDRCANKGARKGFRTTIDLVMEVNGCSAIEAVRQLGEWFGFEVPQRASNSASSAALTRTEAKPPAQAAPPPIITTPIVDFLGDEDDADQPDKMLIAPLLPAGVPSFLAGLPKSLKTWVAILMGVCVAAGRDLFDRFPVTQGSVVIVTEEDTLAQIRRRLWWLARGLGIDPRTLPMRCSALKGFRIDDPAQLAVLEAEGKGASLIVLDALTRVHGADENDRTAMQVVTLSLSQLAARTGATVLVIHHMRKRHPLAGDSERPGQQMRGTGDLHALARAVIAAKKRDDGSIELCAESNYSQDVEPFAVKLHIEPAISRQLDPGEKRTAWFSFEGDAKQVDHEAQDAKVFDALKSQGRPQSKTELRAVVGGKAEAVDAAIGRLSRQGKIELVEAEKTKANGKPHTFKGWQVVS